MRAGELALLLVYWTVAQMRENYSAPFPHPSPFMADETDGPRFMRVGELAMSLTSCNIWESRPSTSPAQQSWAGLVAGVAGELA